MAILTYRVNYSTLVDPGSVCTNPTITPVLPTGGLAIVCDNGDSIDIQINTDIAGPHCLDFIVDCTGTCDTCGSTVIKKCFCTDADDCGECQNCVGNVCVSRCQPGQVCNNDTCSGCSDEFPCPANQVCSQGVCRCPADKPILRADGVCVECLDGEDLGNCLICVNGTIVAVDCPDGHCNPNTGNCQECLNNSHCNGPNECCGPTGACDCCPGYILDPDTNQCVPAPPCTSAEDCTSTYGKCYYCTPSGCQPIVCPAGFICDPNTGECVPSCEDGNCPVGYGCLNGHCVPCNTLSCNGSGPQCQFAEGCQCEGNTCEWIDCQIDNVEMQWVVTPGTPGTVQPGTGLPALQGTTNITPTGIIYVQPPAGAGYMNHQFALAVTNGTSGTWTLYHDTNTTVSLGSGTSVMFDLAGTAPGNGPNLLGFVVKFVETNTGRTATWGFYRDWVPFTTPNVWNYEFQGTGTPVQTTGGTPGSIQLCATNANFTPTGVSDVVTTGTISVSFVATGGNCLVAYITGCGTWSGNVTANCGGNTVTIPAPSFTRDPANCCDPTDPNCDGWGTGDPCNGITIRNITLRALPNFGENNNGDGEFMVSADWESAGLTFMQFFFLGIAPGCWSTANNPAAASNDIQIVTSNAQSPWGPNPSALGVNVTLGDGGCVRLGHTCDLLIGGCEKLQGEICLKECTNFAVEIVNTTGYTFMAVPSMNDEIVTYEWSYPGLVNNTGQTVLITPVGGSSTLTVTARYGSPVKCTATDSINLNVPMPGCRNRAACNYDPTAATDDGSCVVVGPPSYSCPLGFEPGYIEANTGTPLVQFYIAGQLINRGQALAPGQYVVQVKINGVDACPHSLSVPQCYNCNAGVCVQASPVNLGIYSTSNCDNACDNTIQINIQEDCVNNGTRLTITATGSTGNYTAQVNQVGGPTVLPLTALTDSGSITTPILGNGVYRVVVNDSQSSNSRDWSAACHDCAQDTMALTNYSINCAGNYTVTYTITPDPYATYYTVQLLTPLGVQVPGATATWTGGGTYSMPLGTYPGDGVYTLRVTNNLGCVKNYDLQLNCNSTLLPCPITSAGLSYVNTGGTTLFSSSFTLDTAGGNYSAQLYTTTGGTPTSCTNAVLGTPIGAPVNVIGVSGTNTVNFSTPVTTPAVGTCYGVRIQRLGSGYELCQEDAFVLVLPGTPMTCSGSVTGISYNTATGQVLVSWDFENTSDSLTVQIDAYASGTCGTGPATSITSTGNGENGLNIPFNGIPQLQGTTQCVRVTVFDEADPTCTATLDGTIAACSCAVEVTGVVIDPDTETAEVTYTTRCTSGDVTIDITGDATGSGTNAAASTDGTVDTHTQVISLVGYPSVGGNIAVEVTDDINALCTDTLNVALPANCVSCSQVASFFDGFSTVKTVIDTAANTIVASAIGKYDMNSATEIAELETVIQARCVFEGGNFCATGTPVDVGRVPGAAGVSVNQDSDDFVPLDYATIEHASFVGARKTYFGSCGCTPARTCDYTVTMDFLPLSGATNNINFYMTMGDSGNSQYMTTLTYDMGFVGLIDASITTALAAAIQAMIEGANCGYVVGTVTASYNTGTDELTITIPDTSAAIGLVFAAEVDLGTTTDTYEFTQSGCV